MIYFLKSSSDIDEFVKTHPVLEDYKLKVKDLGYRVNLYTCLLYTSPSPRYATLSRMPSSA